MTSHDAVFKLRRLLKEKKIGHGGTLDPDVTGVLPIALGRATRVIEYMTDSGKVYEGTITIGFSTTTEDASGDLVAQTPVVSLSDHQVDEAMASFVGEIIQIPPMYSAVKVKGRKLYEYARQGETVDRPKRQVVIKVFKRTTPVRLENGTAVFGFYVACGKGTYVRTLAVDLGAKLGYASHMSSLVRTASAGLELSQAVTLSDIEKKVLAGDWGFLLPMEYGVHDLPRVDISQEAVHDLVCGRFIVLERQEELLAAFFENRVVAILERRGEWYKPRKVLQYEN